MTTDTDRLRAERAAYEGRLKAVRELGAKQAAAVMSWQDIEDVRELLPRLKRAVGDRFVCSTLRLCDLTRLNNGSLQRLDRPVAVALAEGVLAAAAAAEG